MNNFGEIVLEFVNIIFDKNTILIDEGEKNIKISGTSKFSNAEQFIEFLNKIFSSKIKDICKIILDIPQNAIKIKSYEDIEILKSDINMLYNKENIILYIDKLKLLKKLKEYFTINDNVEVNVYFELKALKDKLKVSQDYLESLLNENKYSIFIVIKDSIHLVNNAFCIINEKDIFTLDIEELVDQYIRNIIQRRKEVANRIEYSNWINSTKWISPNELFITPTDINNLNDVEKVLIQMCTDLIIKFIANITTEIDGIVKSIFIGSKRIEIEFNCKEYKYESLKDLYKLYKWIFNDSCSEKLNITRNIITNIVVAKCQGVLYDTIIVNSDWILKSAKDTYTNYLENVVNNFFQDRYKLLDRINKNISGMNSKIDELISKNITNLIGLLGTIITGIITYSKKDMVNLNSVKIILLGYCIFLILNTVLIYPNIIKRYKHLKDDFEKNVQDYENKFRFSESIEIEKNHFNDNDNLFIIYKKCILTAIVVLIILLLVLIFKKGILEYFLNRLFSLS